MESLISILHKRRSVRKYDREPIDEAAVRNAALTAAGAPAFKTGPGWDMKFYIDPEAKKEVQRAATSGLRGKSNPWLASEDIPGLVCLTGAPAAAPVKGDRQYYIAEAAFAFEYFMLAARELGLGTCWTGAFDDKRLAAAIELEKGRRIVAISPIGKPFNRTPPPIDFSGHYDNYTRQFMHRNRKPIDEIAFSEIFDRKPDWDLALDHDVLKESESGKLRTGTMIPSLLKSMQFPKTFANKNIETSKLNWIIEAARLAPSASNIQPWRFVIIRAKDKLWRLEDCAHNQNGLQIPFPEASTVIVALADQLVTQTRGQDQPYFMFDIPIAISHMMITANDLGIACNLVLNFHENRIRKLVRAPIRTRVVALLALGYPCRNGTDGDFPDDVQRHEIEKNKNISII